MVQGGGFWLNPQTNEFFPVVRHETWIHDVENARKTGLEEGVVKRIGKLKLESQEEQIRQIAIEGGLVRMRDYYNYLVAQFSAPSERMPMVLKSICSMAKQAYPFVDRIRFDNLLTKETKAFGFHAFCAKLEKGEEVDLRS